MSLIGLDKVNFSITFLKIYNLELHQIDKVRFDPAEIGRNRTKVSGRRYARYNPKTNLWLWGGGFDQGVLEVLGELRGQAGPRLAGGPGPGPTVEYNIMNDETRILNSSYNESSGSMEMSGSQWRFCRSKKS